MQPWAPAGGARVGASPHPLKITLWVAFFTCAGLFATFFCMWGALYGLAPPTKFSAGTHGCSTDYTGSPRVYEVHEKSLNLACNNISKYWWKCSRNSAKLYDFPKKF